VIAALLVLTITGCPPQITGDVIQHFISRKSNGILKAMGGETGKNYFFKEGWNRNYCRFNIAIEERCDAF